MAHLILHGSLVSLVTMGNSYTWYTVFYKLILHLKYSDYIDNIYHLVHGASLESKEYFNMWISSLALGDIDAGTQSIYSKSKMLMNALFAINYHT